MTHESIDSRRSSPRVTTHESGTHTTHAGHSTTPAPPPRTLSVLPNGATRAVAPGGHSRSASFTTQVRYVSWFSCSLLGSAALPPGGWRSQGLRVQPGSAALPHTRRASPRQKGTWHAHSRGRGQVRGAQGQEGTWHAHSRGKGQVKGAQGHEGTWHAHRKKTDTATGQAHTEAARTHTHTHTHTHRQHLLVHPPLNVPVL